MKHRNQRGFSMVEMVIALGVLAFAFLAVVALLPVGAQINKISMDEALATNILTALEADLRNNYPTSTFNSLASGRSQLCNLSLPYVVSSGRVTLNYSLVKPALTTTMTAATTSGFTVGLDDSFTVVPITSVPPPHFQASVVYTAVPASGSLLPIEARLIVNWPAISGTALTISNLTDTTKVRGFVQSYVTFNAP